MNKFLLLISFGSLGMCIANLVQEVHSSAIFDIPSMNAYASSVMFWMWVGLFSAVASWFAPSKN
jgi:hypothetical protein